MTGYAKPGEISSTADKVARAARLLQFHAEGLANCDLSNQSRIALGLDAVTSAKANVDEAMRKLKTAKRGVRRARTGEVYCRHCKCYFIADDVVANDGNCPGCS